MPIRSRKGKSKFWKECLPSSQAHPIRLVPLSNAQECLRMEEAASGRMIGKVELIVGLYLLRGTNQ
ncbi:hypothetical protein LINPERHAP1_LOCUS26481, partial [Linum perenne]